jgi:hypothetical protein
MRRRRHRSQRLPIISAGIPVFSSARTDPELGLFPSRFATLGHLVHHHESGAASDTETIRKIKVEFQTLIGYIAMT